MIVDDILINASAEDIVSELHRQNPNLFRRIRPNGENIQTTCPFHSNGQERNPSFGISQNGLTHCFTCGYSATIDRFVSDLYNIGDFGEWGKRWLMKNFYSNAIETREPISFSRNRVTKSIQTVPEEELDSYRYIHQYMYDRGLTDELIELWDIGYDKETNSITFPIADINGNIRYVARRSIASKIYNYPKNVDKEVYGAYRVILDNCKTVWITESFFNCLTCWKFGIPAVALMGCSVTEYQVNILKQLPAREYVLALDPDKAGREGNERLYRMLKDSKQIKYLIYQEENKDINDLQEKIKNLSICY